MISPIFCIEGGYGLDQETPKALEAWFAWAIANFVSGETYDTNHVWNPETREPELCKPGRGFFSPPDRTTIEGVVEWEEGTLGVGSQMMVWMRPYPNVHQKPYVSVKYLDENDVVLQSASGFAQATAHQGHALFKHTLNADFADAKKLQVQLVVKRLGGEGQLQTTHLIEDLNELELNSFEFGKQHGIPQAWLDHEETEEDEDGGAACDTDGDEPDDDAGAAPPVSRPVLTVVQVDDHFIMPPPKSNTVHEPEYGKAIVPHVMRMVTCPRCSTEWTATTRIALGRRFVALDGCDHHDDCTPTSSVW